MTADLTPWLAARRAAVEAATPGSWSIESKQAPNGEFEIVAPADPGDEPWNIAVTHGSCGYGEGETGSLANATLIALMASPDVAGKLLDVVEAAAQLDHYDDLSEPRHGESPGCNEARRDLHTALARLTEKDGPTFEEKRQATGHTKLKKDTGHAR